jgi:hypothetical protein
MPNKQISVNDIYGFGHVLVLTIFLFWLALFSLFVFHMQRRWRGPIFLYFLLLDSLLSPSLFSSLSLHAPKYMCNLIIYIYIHFFLYTFIHIYMYIFSLFSFMRFSALSVSFFFSISSHT